MSNTEIIVAEKVLRNITEEVHTYAKWQQLGYQVKRGEKALIQTRLWKKVKSKKDLENVENKDDVQGNFRLVKASLFSRSQVEKIAN